MSSAIRVGGDKRRNLSVGGKVSTMWQRGRKSKDWGRSMQDEVRARLGSGNGVSYCIKASQELVPSARR